MSRNSLDKDKIKFLLLEGVHASAEQVLQAAGYTNIESIKTALSEEELDGWIASAERHGREALKATAVQRFR